MLTFGSCARVGLGLEGLGPLGREKVGGWKRGDDGSGRALQMSRLGGGASRETWP